jgi:hypothetical protein
MNPATDREALRQQMLLRALWRDARPGVVAGWMRDGERFARGLAAYQANAGALAARALGAAYPTVAQLVGDESFGALARVFWRRHAPLRGDIAEWGCELPRFIADDEQLAGEPYLADVARLDWAVHRAELACDDDGAPAGLEQLVRLAQSGRRPRLVLRAGAALVESPHPIVAIRHAHRAAGEGPERFAAVRAAFAAGRGECALVVREGWRVRVQAVGAAEARFVDALLAARPIDDALASAGAGFDFTRWFTEALRAGWIGRAEASTSPGSA